LWVVTEMAPPLRLLTRPSSFSPSAFTNRSVLVFRCAGPGACQRAICQRPPSSHLQVQGYASVCRASLVS
jgi:hypothetical protein